MSKKNKNIEVHYDSLILLNECLSNYNYCENCDVYYSDNYDRCPNCGK